MSVLLMATYFFLNTNHLKMKNLFGETALVTGGSNGLGQQICIKLAQQGCNVIIADISDADVSNHQEILKIREILLDEFESIDIVINNAGLIPYKSIFEQSSDDIETLTKVNLNSVLFVSKYFLVFEFILS